jgi:osmoprotectant transport system substrate-binding protein
MRKPLGMTLGLVLIALIVSWVLPLGALCAEKKSLVVGSKQFTEQRILGQILLLLLEKNGFEVKDQTGLGGTAVVREALLSKQIDLYVEYTGTGLINFLKKDPITDPQKCYEAVKKEDLEKNGLVWLAYMPFNNTYCLMMQREKAQKMGIKTLSDLAKYVKAHPEEIKFGLNAEFYARADGYRPLQKAYEFEFPEDKIVKMDPGLLYTALKDGQLDVAMGFATDGRIEGFNLVVLEDDKHFFPVYNACPVVRKETLDKYPELEKIFAGLTQKLDSQAMTKMNYHVDIEHKDPKEVAKAWLQSVGLL